MTDGPGDDGRTAPSGSNPGVARAPAITPGRVVVRNSDGGAGDSSMMGAADTAMAMNASQDTMAGVRANTDPDVRTSMSDGDIDYLLGTTLLGRYQITKKIGQGGMGAVYEAQHTLIGKRVAVKVLLDKYIKKEQVVARLEQEARLASSIGHEHIIDITDFGQTSDGRTFVVMEFLEGESLAECLAREGSLPEARILQVAFQIASALGAAHAKGVIHRDVKPENVFLLRRKEKDFIKVVDFGISKSLRNTGEGEDSPRLTQTGMVLGTPLYMSPEQARGDDALDHRIDVYALGVIMYELATGRVPFGGTNYLSVISQVLNDDPVRPRDIRPDLSEEFEAIVLRAIEKDKDRRYQSTDEFLADLTALLEDPMRSTHRRRIIAPRRVARGRSGLRSLAWVAGLSIVVAAVVVSVSLTMGSGKKAAAPPIDAAVAAIVIDAAPPIDTPPPPPKIEVVTIWIDTIPSGAMLYEGDRELGRAPLPYEAQLDSEKIELVAVLDKYDDSGVVIRPLVDRKHDDEADPVKVRMTKAKAGGPKILKPRGKGHGTGTGTAGGTNAGTSAGTSGGTGGGGSGDLEDNPFKRKKPQ